MHLPWNQADVCKQRLRRQEQNGWPLQGLAVAGHNLARTSPCSLRRSQQHSAATLPKSMYLLRVWRACRREGARIMPLNTNGSRSVAVEMSRMCEQYVSSRNAFIDVKASSKIVTARLSMALAAACLRPAYPGPSWSSIRCRCSFCSESVFPNLQEWASVATMWWIRLSTDARRGWFAVGARAGYVHGRRPNCVIMCSASK